MTNPTILVPIRVLEGESIPDGVPELLANAHVVLVGYHVIPEQTATGQARMQFEDQATDRLEAYEAMFTRAGASVDRRLVFTHDAQQTIDRQIAEHGCLAALVPNAVGTVEDVLVAVRGTVGSDRLAQLVAGVFGQTEATVTLYHVATDDETDEDAKTLLDGLVGRLESLELDPAQIETRVDRKQDAFDAIVDAAADVDVVVMGETDPSLATFVFGMPADQLAERFFGPVFVVQRDRPESDSESEE